MGRRARPDRLSDLPLGLIHHILERLPLEDAIATSLLSRQWRYNWTTLPRILLTSTGFDWHDKDAEFIEEFRESRNNFITNVLLHHKGSILRFEMSYSVFVNVDSIRDWILHLSRNGIRELLIKVRSVYYRRLCLLKSSLYSCENLTELELWRCTMDPFPSSFKGFLFLTSLVLNSVEFSPDTVERLVTNSPLLERLKIINYRGSKRISVIAPNLKNLHLSGQFTELCLCTPLVTEMYMCLEDPHFKPEPRGSNSNYFSFCHGFPYLVELTGSGYFTRYLSIGVESCHQTLLLNNLVSIQLGEVNFRDVKEMSVVYRLIGGSPNLQKLEISTMWPEDEDGVPDLPFRDCFEYAPNITLGKLKFVSFPLLRSYRSEMQFIKFLLESSPVLQTMELQTRFMEVESRHSYDDVLVELLGFRRASPNARISVVTGLTALSP